MFSATLSFQPESTQESSYTQPHLFSQEGEACVSLPSHRPCLTLPWGQICSEEVHRQLMGSFWTFLTEATPAEPRYQNLATETQYTLQHLGLICCPTDVFPPREMLDLSSWYLKGDSDANWANLK